MKKKDPSEFFGLTTDAVSDKIDLEDRQEAKDKPTKIITDELSIIEGPTPSIIYRNEVAPEELDGVIKHTLKEISTEKQFFLENSISCELDFIEFVLDSDVLDKMTHGSGSWAWEAYQLDFFKVGLSDSTLGLWYIANKCRQSGMSTAFAAKMFARAILTPRNFEGIFVSYKKDEAVNKIKYVRQFLDALPLVFRKKIVRDPQQLIEWENIDGSRSRIFSHAQKPIRGTAANVIVLDELAFYNFASEIYESALPALAMTKGTMEITSTPFGKGGIFYEVFDDRVKYKNFYREWIYWFQCERYLKPEFKTSYKKVIETIFKAIKMGTEERVETFGSSGLKKFYTTMDLDSFRQEFEGFFVDEQASYFPRDLLYSVIYKEREDISSLYSPSEDEFFDADGKSMSPYDALADSLTQIMRDQRYADIKFKKYDSLQELFLASRTGEVSKNLIAGVDIGATVNSTEIVILEEVNVNGETVQIERYSRSLAGMKLPDQQNELESIVKMNMLRKMCIDETGMGTQLSQYLKGRYPSIIFGFNFSSSTSLNKKEILFKNLRSRMEKGTIALNNDRDTIEHLYSVRRVISDTGYVSYKADGSKRHNADKAIAIALASFVGTPAIDYRGVSAPKKVIYENEGFGTAKIINNVPSDPKRVEARSRVRQIRNRHAGFATSQDPFIKNWDG